MTRTKSPNVTKHQGGLSRQERSESLGHSGAVVWFTGLSGSGKSTVATAVERLLVQSGRVAYLLDGDGVRHGLNGDLGFSPDDRKENIRRVGEVAGLFLDAGLIALAAFVSPYRNDRDRVRALCGEGRFFEVYVDTPLAVCESRDPKGLYRKARSGEIQNMTGIQAPYESPLTPELHLHTEEASVDECAQLVVRMLEASGIVPAEG